MYISVQETANKWGLSTRRVIELWENKKIKGVTKVGIIWNIPADSKKPKDPRKKIDYSGEIAKNKTILNSLRELTEGEKERFKEDYLVDFIYNSNAFGGNKLSREDTLMVLQGVSVEGKMVKDTLEVLSQKEAFEEIIKLSNNNEPLTEETIKRLHYILLSDKPRDRGEYRKVATTIFSQFKTAEPRLIERQIEELLKLHNHRKDGDIVKRISLFHIIFESIHPFIDGNGRLGRLLINLELMKNGFPPVVIKVEDRQTYYDAFEACLENGDLSIMENLLAEQLNDSLEKYIKILEG